MINFVSSIWFTFCELSPWLLIGMFLSGLLHVILPSKFVREKLQGFSGVLKSVAIGVPLPLCSCGVIPAGVGLKKDGASSGAAVGFLISTPQTGVDSMLVSAAFFGWPFAIFKLVSAAVMGIFGGVWIDQKPPAVLHTNAVSQCSGDHQGHDHGHHHHGDSGTRGWNQFLPHSIDMLRSIWIWLVVGVVVSAAINQFDIQPLTAQVNQWGLFPAILLVLILSVPMYVCATASVPIAAALVSAGLPPAVALVFLMAGPATNIATMGAIRSNLGGRCLTIYMTTIIIGSMLAAYLFNSLVSVATVGGAAHVHDATTWWAQLSAMIVLGLIGLFVFEMITRRFGTEAVQSPTGLSTTIGIGGMSCENCVHKLESAIKKVAGVTSVQVSLGEASAIVTGEFDTDQLKQTIADSGFVPKEN